MAWWYNILTNQVEEGAGAPNSERLGPFDTELEAQNALDKVKERNDEWSKQNAEWEGDKGAEKDARGQDSAWEGASGD
ncbi:MAG: SPOR domain-containing protein [Candidatus Nanopelagicales bacterium]